MAQTAAVNPRILGPSGCLVCGDVIRYVVASAAEISDLPRLSLTISPFVGIVQESNGDRVPGRAAEWFDCAASDWYVTLPRKPGGGY